MPAVQEPMLPMLPVGTAASERAQRAGEGPHLDAPAVARSLLRNVPVLAGLSDELLDELARSSCEVHVRAGEWIMHEGQAAHSLFIVASGRVEVIDEGPPEALIRVLRRGDVLGELALLREGTRSASARARRDAELIELGRDAFEMLIQQAPSFALGLTRAMGAQLAASRTPVVAGPPPRTMAIVGLDESAPVASVAVALERALMSYGPVARLQGGDLASIDRAERAAERVVLQCDGRLEEEWSALAMGEADLVIAVSGGSLDERRPPPPVALNGCELLVFGARLPAAVLVELQPRAAQVVRDVGRRADAVEALARRLAGRSLGVVLSGGGARAFAHLGVLEELRAAGLRFDRIAGVSLGSLVAAACATDMPLEEIYERFERSFVADNPSRDFALPAYALIRGAKTRRGIEQVFGAWRIEELPLRFFCVSCDLIAREGVVHSSGPLAEAVYASLAIPGVFPPVATEDGRLLVDGGVLDNLPVARMARKGEGPVIAVDVTGRMGAVKASSRPRLARAGRSFRKLMTGSEVPIPHLGETIVRSMLVGSTDTVTAARMHADLVITPQVEGTGLVDWKAFPRMVELGREAVRQTLENPKLRDRLPL